MEINGRVTVEITDKEIGRALLRRAIEELCESRGYLPDGDYHTDEEERVYVNEVCLGVNPRIATLINAGNYLIYGKRPEAGKIVRQSAATMAEGAEG
jgi:hypothetical protein